MADKKGREKFKPTQEEFIGDGISDLKKGNEEGKTERNPQKNKQTPYEDRSLEDLRSEARARGISGFGAMRRAELVNTLSSMPQPGDQSEIKDPEKRKK